MGTGGVAAVRTSLSAPSRVAGRWDMWIVEFPGEEGEGGEDGSNGGSCGLDVTEKHPQADSREGHGAEGEDVVNHTADLLR